jgi:hypothetical protein
MRRIIPFVALLLAGCATPAPKPVVVNPVSIMPPMVAAPRAMLSAIAIKRQWTNSITLAWVPSPESDVVGYRLYYGTNSGVYYATLDFGLVTQAVLKIITPTSSRIFLNLISIDSSGLESPFGKEVHWPAYAPTLIGFTLIGSGPVQQSVDLMNWGNFTNDIPATLPLTDGNQFFKGKNLNLKPNYYQPE